MAGAPDAPPPLAHLRAHWRTFISAMMFTWMRGGAETAAASAATSSSLSSSSSSRPLADEGRPRGEPGAWADMGRELALRGGRRREVCGLLAG